jgi:aspartate/glutamate racemase
MLSPRIGIREQAVAQLARRAEALQKWGCSHVLIPCDQAQIYVPEVQRRVSVPIGDTTGLVCEAIKSSGAKAVRLIGSSALPTAGRYLELLATSGVELLHWSAEEQALLNEATKLGASRMTATQSNDLRTLVRAKDDKEVVRVVTSYELHRAQLGASQAPQIDAMRIAADAVVGLLMG